MFLGFCKKNHRGQGLLETVIALGILITGLFSVFSLAISNFTSQQAGLLRVQALNLAREGVEAVRNTRDSNWLAGQPTWQDILVNDQVIRVQLIFDPADGSKQFYFDGINNLAQTPVYFKNGLFLQGQEAQDNGQATPFHRMITITPLKCSEDADITPDKCLNLGLPNVIGVEVKSQVGWSSRGGQSELTLTEKFYDWK
ncbi:MAG: hypothetical protein Q8M83_04670 [bacterium]|nr:hypothetical protein [bacterium]